MIRGFLLLAAGLSFTSAVAAQAPLAERLSSPYAHERAGAVAEAAALASGEQKMLLRHENPRVRVGMADAIGTVASRSAARMLIKMIERDGDPAVRARAAAALWRAVVEGSLDWDELALVECVELYTEAVSFVRGRLAAMATKGTTWTDHAALGSFAPMGPWGVLALRRVVGAEDVRMGERCLAALCLGRVDAREFWNDGEGAPSDQLQHLLLDSHPSLQMALLYSASAYAPNTRPFSAAIARFAREDAFGEDVIQAALYCLYTLPDDDLAADTAVAAACAEDFIDVFHSQLVVYNGAQLFRRMRAPELIERALEVLTEEPSFAGYWLFTGLLENFAFLEEEDGAKRARALLEWGLSDANPIPQIRGQAAWHWRARYGDLPDGLDLDGLLAAIRASIAELHPVSVDPDNYAQRSGVDILAHLEDPDGAAVIRPLLGHHSEAVRMASAMAAGDGGYEELADDLAKLAVKPTEYAAFGAAYGLMGLEDRRALEPFCELLGGGNAILARAALANLRLMTKKTLAAGDPDAPSAWRGLRDAWKDELRRTTGDDRRR